MKYKIVFLISIVLLAVISASAQTRSVTNADLEKFRQERLKGEAEYRENYARLGLPSPEELDRRREASRVANEELSQKLRAERLEAERIEAERRAWQQQPTYIVIDPGAQYYDEPYFSSYYRGRGRLPRQLPQQNGYFAGGQFWPTGPSTRPQPMLTRRR